MPPLSRRMRSSLFSISIEKLSLARPGAGGPSSFSSFFSMDSIGPYQARQTRNRLTQVYVRENHAGFVNKTRLGLCGQVNVSVSADIV